MSRFLDPGINVLLDGQYGSSGKGKLAAYLAENADVVYNTADYAPNAGHTVVYKGQSYVTKTIPSGFVNRDARLYLTPISMISVPQLLKEVEMLADFGVANRLSIHPHAGLVTQEDVDAERATMGAIASTMTGGGAALARKIARKAKTAKDEPLLARWVRDCTEDVGTVARKGGIVLAETAQGFDLSLNHGSYPYVTSRDVTTANVLANLGAPPQLLARVWAAMRTFPIRVGHLLSETGEKLGDSGPHYLDQREMTWDEITAGSGSATALLERTTVTKRVRRIFTWSDRQYERFLNICQPTDLFLNFVNYLDSDLFSRAGCAWYGELLDGTRGLQKLAPLAKRIHQTGLSTLGLNAPRISLLGTGPNHEHMIEVA